MESNNPLKVQSADVPAEEFTSQVLTFVDNSAGDSEDIGYTPSPIISAGCTLNTDLQQFLSRPTKIDTRTWTTATLDGVLGAAIEPWYLFMNNTVIKRKLENYAYFRAKLCLKFIINGTPFHYGKLLVAYEPGVNVADTGFRNTRIRAPTALVNSLLVPYSQLPHVFLTVADNSGGELKLPFFYHADWLPLNSAAEVKSMGKLTYFQPTPLRVASTSASTSVTIETYAWLEDVELNGSTAQLILQAKDEYDGPISKPATAVAAFSRSLENIPIIGKFARATTIGAGAIASIASIFGFTNTPVIDSVHAVVPVGCPHLASSEISTPVQKLTLDPKQELSIDNSMHGLDGKDHMALQNIISKPTVIGVAGWTTTDAVDTYVFTVRVNPCLCYPTDVLDPSLTKRATRVYHTWLSYVASAFTHWRGDIIFDIEVVCTKFHKGRLKISWDPEQYAGTGLADENKVFTTILDIGETNKASLRVPYHQSTAWLRTGDPKLTMMRFGGVANVGVVDEDNGQLTVTVLTPLMSPITPSDLGIMISVRGAENFEFSNPRQNLTYAQSDAPPSFFAVQAKDEIDIETKAVTFGDEGSSHPHRYDQNMGQSIQSLRTLLHRYSLYDVSCETNASATRCYILEKSYSRLPPSFGFDPNGLSTCFNTFSTGGTNLINYTPTHPLTYFANLYGGFTGGVNYVANISSDLKPSVGDIRVSRCNISSFSSYRAGFITHSVISANGNNITKRFYNMLSQHPNTAGGAYTNTMTNGSLNWYAPHMLETNWCYTDPADAVLGNSYDKTTKECTLLNIYVKQTTAYDVANNFTVTSYAGAGVDFNLFWLLCCPTVDYYTAIPNSNTG